MGTQTVTSIYPIGLLHSMIAAPQRLNSLHPQPLPDKMAAFGITGSGIKRLFMTHPPLEECTEALKAGR